MKLVVLFVALLSIAAAPATQPAAPTTLPSEQIRELLSGAIEKLRAGQNEEAVAALADVLKQFPKNRPVACDEHAIALHAIAVAYMNAGANQKAREPIDRAFAYSKTSPTLALNRVKLDITQRGFLIRAIRELDRMLAAHVDEETINLFGAALFRASNNAADRSSAHSFFDHYEKFNAKLEATKPGMKHWGSTWMTAADYEKTVRPPALVADLAKRKRSLDSATRRMQDAAREVENARLRALGDAKHQRENQSRVRDAEERYERAKQDVEEAQGKYDDVASQFPKPQWIEHFEPAVPDLTLVPKI